jgi:2-polyprenyl-3-methyl-5-hydroxy-6-metoxy-1,4-benzoquinol methylase
MNESDPDVDPGRRRLGDTVEISGDYQHVALTEGPAIQQAWHRTRVELLDWFHAPQPGEHLLDVGCGSGIMADRLAQLGAQVLGIDANPAAVDYARTTFGRAELEFRAGYLDQLELAPASFDGATCFEVIEHVFPDQVRKLMDDLFALIRPGGSLLITTPNYRGLWPLIEWLTDRVGPTTTMAGDQHVTHFHRRMLRAFLEQAGFEVVKVRTFCTFGPFLTPASRRLSDGCGQLERRVDLPFGNLLAALARRPA